MTVYIDEKRKEYYVNSADLNKFYTTGHEYSEEELIDVLKLMRSKGITFESELDNLFHKKRIPPTRSFILRKPTEYTRIEHVNMDEVITQFYCTCFIEYCSGVN